VAFLTYRGGFTLAVVSADGSSETRMVGGPFAGPGAPLSATISPDWQSVAVTRYGTHANRLSVARLDETDERDLAAAAPGTSPAWSPDSRRIAFRAADQSLAVIDVDGSDPVRIAGGGTAMAWSPDGSRVAFVGGSVQNPDIRVVSVQGSGEVTVAGGPGSQLEPRWSPDGTRIAFLTQPADGERFALGVVRADGSGLRTYPGPEVSSPDAFAWTPDGRGILYAQGAIQGFFFLDIPTGKARRLTQFGGTPEPSPDGSRIAFTGGGECRDRVGIYVAGADGRRVRRLTNDCRLLGTEGDDVIAGTDLADVLVGLAGNDRLVARDGYMGDTLLGGEGDDLLVGGFAEDIVRGGPGNDRLLGGRRRDALYGGPGGDFIDAEGGRDFVYAQDGGRDQVKCGTNLDRKSERDEVWVDRLDDVARDCEVVHRRR
jgi:hypothetical protein